MVSGIFQLLGVKVNPASVVLLHLDIKGGEEEGEAYIKSLLKPMK